MNIRVAVLFCVFALAALAADIGGKWTGDMEGRDGQTMTVTMNLKADGNAVTGTVSGRMGDAQISNGKVDGDSVTFDVVREFNGNSVTIHYTGTVTGDSIKFKVQGPRGPARDLTAKRATA